MQIPCKQGFARQAMPADTTGTAITIHHTIIHCDLVVSKDIS